MQTTYYHHVRRISAPVAEIISLAEAKLYLRVDHVDDDVLISEQIVAVRMFTEDYLGRSLVNQDWQVEYHQPVDRILLPMTPVQEVTEVAIIDSVGVSVVLDPSEYHFITPQLLKLYSMPCGIVRVTFRAGDDEFTMPYALKQAILSHIALCYEKRGCDVMQPVPAHRLYEPYKEVHL